MTKKIIIDTDPGIDDAIAICIALFDETIDVKLISTVYGNVNLNKVTKNALKLRSFLNKTDVKIAKGCEFPFIRKVSDASNVHGETGMDGFDFPVPDESQLESEHAVNVMYKTLKENKKMTVVAIGPLTNIATLISMYPDAIEYIEELIIMGGSFTRGNKGVMSEFNINLDPESAKKVFESKVKKVLAPLDMGLKALVYPEDSEKIRKMNRTGEMFYSLFKKYRGGSFNTGLKMYDLCAIAYLLKPDLFEIQDVYVEVDTQSDLSAGNTYIDFRGYLKKEPNMKVLTEIDQLKFKKWFLESIKKCEV